MSEYIWVVHYWKFSTLSSMVTYINSPKSCSKSNWYKGKCKLCFFNILTENNLTKFFIKLKISIAFRHLTDQTIKSQKRNIHLWHPHKRVVGGGFLKCFSCLQIPLFLNNILVLFADGESGVGGGGSFVSHFLWTS